MPGVEETARVVSDLGVLAAFFVVVISIVGFYLVKVLPEDRKYSRTLNQTILEQVALSRQALETSNLVIEQNSDEMRANRESHKRLGERLEAVEDCLHAHDLRAEAIAKDVAVIKERK